MYIHFSLDEVFVFAHCAVVCTAESSQTAWTGESSSIVHLNTPLVVECLRLWTKVKVKPCDSYSVGFGCSVPPALLHRTASSVLHKLVM